MVAHESSEDFQEHRYRRRLVGAAVLIAMAVIFLPLIFDGSGTESQFTRISPLEDPPEFDAEILPEGELSAQFGSGEIAFTDSGETLSFETSSDTGIAEPAAELPVATDELEADVTEAPALATPAPVEPTASVAAAETSPSHTATEARPKVSANVEPQPRREPKPQAESQPVVADNSKWLIQVASFGDKINALTLRSDLKQKGYEVDVRAGESGGQPVFRVSVGPVVGEQKARSMKGQVEQALDRGTLLLPLGD